VVAPPLRHAPPVPPRSSSLHDPGYPRDPGLPGGRHGSSRPPVEERHPASERPPRRSCLAPGTRVAGDRQRTTSSVVRCLDPGSVDSLSPSKHSLDGRGGRLLCPEVGRRSAIRPRGGSSRRALTFSSPRVARRRPTRRRRKYESSVARDTHLSDEIAGDNRESFVLSLLRLSS